MLVEEVVSSPEHSDERTGIQHPMKSKDVSKLPLVIKTSRGLFQQLKEPEPNEDQVRVADASTSSESENKSPRHSYPLEPIDPTTLHLVIYQGKFPKPVELEEVVAEYASTSSESDQGSPRQSYPIEPVDLSKLQMVLYQKTSVLTSKYWLKTHQ